MNIIPRNSRFTFSSDVFFPFGKLVKFNSAAVKPSRLCSGGVAENKAALNKRASKTRAKDEGGALTRLTDKERNSAI